MCIFSSAAADSLDKAVYKVQGLPYAENPRHSTPNSSIINRIYSTILLRALRWRSDGDEVVREALRIGSEEIVDAGEVRGADD